MSPENAWPKNYVYQIWTVNIVPYTHQGNSHDGVELFEQVLRNRKQGSQTDGTQQCQPADWENIECWTQLVRMYLIHLDFRAFLEVSIHRFRLLPQWLFVDIYLWSLQLTTPSEWRNRRSVCSSQCPEGMCRSHWIYPRQRVRLCLGKEQRCWRAETKMEGRYINKNTRIIQ